MDQSKGFHLVISMRISQPTFHPQKAGEIILYILAKCPKITQEKLYDMLYFIDMDFYEKYEEHLMGFSWKKEHDG